MCYIYIYIIIYIYIYIYIYNVVLFITTNEYILFLETMCYLPYDIKRNNNLPCEFLIKKTTRNSN